MTDAGLDMRSHVGQACDELGIVGAELRGLLAREIPSKVLLRQARDVVLLTGATGAGKEKVAALVHDSARRVLKRQGELVEVNCANLSGHLFEGELFGYKKGAFTGAERDYGGLIARAQGGTLVLDEVQALEPANQARLLRLLGEREYRPVGDERVKKSDALILLASNKNLLDMVQKGAFRKDLLDRATAKVALPSLFERRQDISDLSQAFAMEAGRDLGAQDTFFGLTRRARADIEVAVVRAQEVSVRRLREIVRDAVFTLAADALPEVIDSELLMPLLERELGFVESHRDAQDVIEIEREFELAVGMGRLRELQRQHDISAAALAKLCHAVQGVIDEMSQDRRSYRNVVERTHRLSKVALWLVSGARTQADFRRYFGQRDIDMPTKSVAHQLYHEVFPDDDDAKGGAA